MEKRYGWKQRTASIGGYITHKKLLRTVFGWRQYYIVDNEYCSRTFLDPFYRKGTEVYFLYFPGFMNDSYMGGIVVRKIF